MIALPAAVILDIIIGDPPKVPHPIRLIGKCISYLDDRLCKPNRPAHIQFILGMTMWFIVMLLTFGVTASVTIVSYRLNAVFGAVVETILSTYILAAGSLRDETMKVYDSLGRCKPFGGSEDEERRLKEARGNLSMIVGRDTQALDEAGIVRAAVETVAENTSDGVLAPLLYLAVGGPVLGMCYKAINTMDSMTGYHNEKYEYFGKFAARADDVANLIPSRLSAWLMMTAALLLGLTGRFGRFISSRPEVSYSFAGAVRVWVRDRYKHKSPNSAQTESVCAGSLGIRLGGSSYYGGRLVEKPYIGDDRRPIETDDIKRAISLMFTSEILAIAVFLAIYAVFVLKEPFI